MPRGGAGRAACPVMRIQKHQGRSWKAMAPSHILQSLRPPRSFPTKLCPFLIHFHVETSLLFGKVAESARLWGPLCSRRTSNEGMFRGRLETTWSLLFPGLYVCSCKRQLVTMTKSRPSLPKIPNNAQRVKCMKGAKPFFFSIHFRIPFPGARRKRSTRIIKIVRSSKEKDQKTARLGKIQERKT